MERMEPATSSTSKAVVAVSLQLSRPCVDENHDLVEKSPKDRLSEMMDMLEMHVERLRKDAFKLEEEKDGLLASLDTLRHDDSLNHVDDFDRDDIMKCTERIINRCQTVEVRIHTTRDHTQEEALFQVNHLIDGLVVGLKSDPDATKSRCVSYMNACSSHFVNGVMDKNFESALLGCTLDDQKRVKRRLQGLLNYFDKLECEL